MQSPEDMFVEAARQHVLCELTDRAGGLRKVQPYLVFESEQGQILFHCYQVAGHSESGNPVSWKNLPAKSVVSAKITSQSFRIRDDYNPAKFRKTRFFLSKASTGKQV